MAYWWVNQNKTFEQEIAGGYLWSPQTKANGHRNPYYESMVEVEAGDLVFSFKDTLIQAIGVVDGPAAPAAKPSEFGSHGQTWADLGWQVPVTWELLPPPFRIRPKDHMEELAGVLPAAYSPLMPNGDGKQAVYLAKVPGNMGTILMDLIGQTPDSTTQAQDLNEIKRRVAEDVQKSRIISSDLPATTKVALVESRVGQGQFRAGVMTVESTCRFTGIANPALLTASHIKPWAVCDNAQRLDKYNGLMLTPTFDRLFDRGYITIEVAGDVHVSSALPSSDAASLGLSLPLNVGPFNPVQGEYLEYHQTEVFRG